VEPAAISIVTDTDNNRIQKFSSEKRLLNRHKYELRVGFECVKSMGLIKTYIELTLPIFLKLRNLG